MPTSVSTIGAVRDTEREIGHTCTDVFGEDGFLAGRLAGPWAKGEDEGR